MSTAADANLGRARYAVQRQEAIYDGADAPVWRKAIYDLLHDGWELACIGGLAFLQDFACRAGLGPEARVLEFGCGGGAACHYLARLTGCAATGIDRNAAQIARAEARRLGAPEGHLLRFRAGDVEAGCPGETGYDCAFLLDTLSLLREPQIALRAARGALRKDALLFVADLGATPVTQSCVIDTAFAEDGFCSLHDVPTTTAHLAAAGFVEIASRTQTDQAAASFAAVLDWLNGPGVCDVAIGHETLAAWRQNTAFYLRAFQTHQLEYRWWSARAA